MVSGFSYQIPWLKTAFILILALDVAAFAVSLIFLALAFHQQNYGYLQFLGDLRNAEASLQEYDPLTAAERFEQYLKKSLVETADLNAVMNDRRHKYLYWARLAILGTVVLTTLLAVPYMYDHVKVAPKVPVVHIDNLDGKAK